MPTHPIDPQAPVSESRAPADVSSEETLLFGLTHVHGSDVVLRSCDSHNFHTLKTYISNASPVLRKLTRNISNTSDVVNDEESGTLPVVELPENGALLHCFLTPFIFPVDTIIPSTSEKIMELLAVAQKYQMKSVLCHIRGIIAPKDLHSFGRRQPTAFSLHKCMNYVKRRFDLRELRYACRWSSRIWWTNLTSLECQAPIFTSFGGITSKSEAISNQVFLSLKTLVYPRT